ncbi:hypothetical protein CDV52_18070 [Haematobacter missouriensis]|uniref:Uncharacterized protein n=1 Tax=Haematobacter missouriensis TaxID=366616 RepID=A0A212AJ01_9RHOB|nr:hypothetical protein [Haematobacter missouriensis]OWJ81470.1 hypothetical protein CDV52_18070 [Haematobacter missouriensis]
MALVKHIATPAEMVGTASFKRTAGERFAALTPTGKCIILAKLAELEAEQRAARRKGGAA